ncbi:MAG: 50S ribosomal protein L10 [Candidatus Reconcilbacillus cellulovorans]|uniref:Large ribosomal subunit protein uL10 n=1 Tax=Candidatus Reconcilbacillus cellulovorans TaxID=1906605 RepID=A0A2A6E3B0_9BACL|nr:MAG: 50S ribosomal protein L10 [Candidatus Reconcilbacillus cellulovorans]
MANPKIIAEKERIVSEVAAKLKDYACAVLTDYRGLNVAQVTELRKKLREAGVEFKVLKNTLVRRAAVQTNLQGLEDVLVGPTAVAFSKNDPVACAKVLAEFAKTNENLKVKAGVLEGRIVGPDEIKTLAELPSREGLLSMLLSVLQAPIRNFALAVKAVAEQKQGGAQAS